MLTSLRMINEPITCIVPPTTSILIPSGSVIIGFMYSGDTTLMINASTSGRPARIHPVMRPCAVTARTWRFTLKRSRMTAREIVENLREVPARLTLRQDGRREEPGVEDRHPLGHAFQRVAERHAEVLPVVEELEFRTHRRGDFIGDHLNTGRKCVPRAQRARHQLDRLRELLFEHPEAPGALPADEHERKAREQRCGGERQRA